MLKRFIYLLFLALICFETMSQSAKELKIELSESKKRYDSLLKEFYTQNLILTNKIVVLESVLDKIKFALNINNENSFNIPLPNQQPNTSQQLNNSYSAPVNTNISSSSEQKSQTTNKGNISVNGKGDGLTPTTGATIYTGPRGGQYYINKNGNKVYVKKK